METVELLSRMVSTVWDSRAPASTLTVSSLAGAGSETGGMRGVGGPKNVRSGVSVPEYYAMLESRLGYRLLLGGTRHFGWYEPGMSRWEFSRAMRNMEDELARRLDLPEGSHVLDAGCGAGDVARRLAGFGLRVSGVDLLPENVAEARRRVARDGLNDAIRISQGDYSRLPDVPSGSFDGVYTMETLVHVPDVEAALQTFRRILRPGGRLVLFEYAHAPYPQMPSGASAAIRRINELASMPTFDRLEDGVLRNLVEGAGFVGVADEDVTDRMLPMLSAFAALARAPYRLLTRAGLEGRAPNAMSAVEMFRLRGLWSYRVVSAYAPGSDDA